MLEITVLSLFLACVSLGLALVSRPDFAANIDHARTFQSASIEKRDSVPAGYVAAPYYPTPKGGWISSVRILRS
jgi:beta-glucosidase